MIAVYTHILLSTFFPVALLLAACFGIWIVISNWNSSFIKVRQPQAQLLVIFVVFLTGIAGVSNTVMLFILKIHHRDVWYSIIFGNTSLLCFYAVSGYRTWMLVYKSKLQVQFAKFEVNDMLRSEDRTRTVINRSDSLRTTISSSITSRWDKFWEDYGRWLGCSFVMSKVFTVYGLLITSIYLYITLNFGGLPSLWQTTFQPYDYVNMVALSIFIGFNVVYAHCTIFNFSDSFHFTGEVLTVSCLFIVGFTIFWLVFRSAKYDHDDRVAVAFFTLIGTLLLILVNIDYHLYKARVSNYPKCSLRKTVDVNIDGILNNVSICRQFEEHLRKEYSLENLNFLKACETYHMWFDQIDNWSQSSDEKEMKSYKIESLDISIDVSNKNKMARYIFGEFCERGASQEINLSRETIRSLRNKFHRKDYPFEEEIFDNAIGCIKDLLTNDSLRRFKVDTGDLYARL